MRIITLSCPDCGTIVAANLLEDKRVMKCPGITCDNILRFEDMSEADREHVLEHRNRYSL